MADLLATLNKLAWSQRANLALSLMLEKGLITSDDIREALKTVAVCHECDFSTPRCETTEQAGVPKRQAVTMRTLSRLMPRARVEPLRGEPMRRVPRCASEGWVRGRFV